MTRSGSARTHSAVQPLPIRRWSAQQMPSARAPTMRVLRSMSSERPKADLRAMLKQQWFMLRPAQQSSSRQGQSRTAAPCSHAHFMACPTAAQASMAAGRPPSSCAFSASSRWSLVGIASSSILVRHGRLGFIQSTMLLSGRASNSASYPAHPTRCSRSRQRRSSLRTCMPRTTT